MSTLLPCPFCGGANILVKARKTTIVECACCGVVMFDHQDGVRRDVIAAWNRRATTSAHSAKEPSGETMEQREEVCAAWADLPASLTSHPGIKRLYRALGGIAPRSAKEQA